MKYILIPLFVCTSVVTAQPNIIYINADDLGVMDVGFNNSKYHTPNIDRLRAENLAIAGIQRKTETLEEVFMGMVEAGASSNPSAPNVQPPPLPKS